MEDNGSLCQSEGLLACCGDPVCVTLMGSDTLVEDNETLCPCSLCVNVSSVRNGGLQRSSVCHSNRDIEVTNSYIIVDFQIQICSFSEYFPVYQRLPDFIDIQLLLICDLGICGNAMVTENLENFDNNLATFSTQWYRVYNCKELDKMSLPSC